MMIFIQRISRLKTYILAGLAVGVLGALSHVPVESAGLRVAPLMYQETLQLGQEKVGFVDVSNPTDSTVTIRSSVEAFRQINNQGDLEFYEDEQLSAGVEIDVEEFELGPREAARIIFTINSNNLPEGGVYGALFFETDTQGAAEDISGIGTIARVGSLLILQNGEGEKTGTIEDLDVPFWQFGDGIVGTLSYRNSEDEMAVGFNPELFMQVTPWGEEREQEAGLVLPGISREFGVERRGDYFGILPVTVYDEVTGSEMSTWVFAMTGLWRVFLPFLVLVIISSLLLQRYFNRHKTK